MNDFESIFYPLFWAILCAGVALMAIERTYNEILFRRMKRDELSKAKERQITFMQREKSQHD